MSGDEDETRLAMAVHAFLRSTRYGRLDAPELPHLDELSPRPNDGRCQRCGKDARLHPVERKGVSYALCSACATHVERRRVGSPDTGRRQNNAGRY